MILTDINPKERVSKIDAIAKSQDVQTYNMLFDYYQGLHFIRTDYASTDYGRNAIYNIATRSGINLFDKASEEDRAVVKSNWCRPIIETIGDYTRGVNDPIIVNAKQNEELTRKLWEKNKIGILTHEIAYEAGIFGKSYLRVKKKQDGAYEVKTLDAASVHEVMDPVSNERESTIFWFGMSHDDAKRLYPDIQNLSDGQVYYFEEWDDDRVYKYIDGVRINEVTSEGVVRDISPYGFNPFFPVKGNIYETSDIQDVISLNDELNITLTYINEIFKYSAFPMLAPKGTWSNDTPVLDKSQLRDVEISPKTILPIPMEKVKGEGVDSSILDHITQVQKDISIVSGVPIKVLTAEMDGNLSGIALQRMMGSILKQAEIRRSYIKEAFIDITNAIFKTDQEQSETDIVFPSMIRVDDNELLDAAIKKQTLGLSRETIFDELGYDYEEEEKKRETELENSMEAKLITEENELQSNNNGIKKEGTGASEADGR